MSRLIRPVSILSIVACFTFPLLLAGCPITDSNSNSDGSNGNVSGSDGTNSNSNNGGGDGNNAGGGGNGGGGGNTTPTQFTLHVNLRGQGAVEPAGGQFESGTSVTLTAKPITGWRFDHWEGDLTGPTNPAAVTISKELSITAVFVEIGSAPITFYAVYDWIIDDDQLATGIDRTAISADGKKVFFANGEKWNGRRKAYSINPDGSGLVTYNLPDAGPYGASGMVYLAVNQDGSRAFCAPWYDRAIFKLENGTVTTMSVDQPKGPSAILDLATNATGTAVIFRDGNKIWSLDQTGGGLQSLLEDKLVPAAGGKGEGLGDMGVAANGSTIAFIMFVRNTQNGTLSTEVFCLHGGSVTQITDDRRGVNSKGTGISVSGDGNTIVYLDDVQHKYVAVAPDGSHAHAVAATSVNSVNRCLTDDGGQMIWADSSTDGGRIINTDGTGALDLLPGWNVNTMTIAITGPLAISADGKTIVFRYEYSEWPFKRCLYVGHLNDPGAVAAAPKIQSVSFSPATMPRGDANAQTVLTAKITHPDGPAAIKATDVYELVDGIIKGEPDVPVQFPFSPLDDGNSPDAVAGDGIYTCVGKPAGKINDLSQMTVRVGVRDVHNRIVIADATLRVDP